MVMLPISRLYKVPKASFFRSMAGGVPYGATEGSSMGPPPAPPFFTFSGSFFGTPFAPKTVFFARKNQHFEVHFGAQNGVLRGAHFSRFSLFSGSFLGTPFAPKTLFFYKEKSRLLGPFWAPERGPPETHFFMFVCSLQETDDGSDDTGLDLSFTVISKTSVLPRQN